MDSKTAEIPADRPQHVGICFAGAAPAGADLAQAERTAKEFAQLLIKGGGKAELFLTRRAEHQVFTTACRHAMIASLSDGALRTDFHTRGAKDATSKIERDRFATRSRNGLSRADRDAGSTIVGAFTGVDLKGAAMAVGQGGGWTFGISHRLAIAF